MHGEIGALMNRDDTFNITREDVWRELELLPAWKLRTPAEAVLTQKVDIKKFEAVQVAISANEESAPEKPTTSAVLQYAITVSQDRQWAFVSELDMLVAPADIDSQSSLFNNILHALSIEKTSKMQAQSILDIQAKIIVAMGESVAQALLNTQASLENLRGNLHPIGHVQLVATYDLAHMLNKPLDKAKVWQDLCLARSHLQSLLVQD
jgi:hypothetical protein